MSCRNAALAALALVVAVAVPTARASSPAAWAQLEKETAAACAKASDLKDPVVHPATVRFDDSVGIDARWVTGAWKPAHMKGAKTSMLCLYDRKTKRAVAQEAVAWKGAMASPAKTPVKAQASAPASARPAG
jgi:hypothetical protein